MAAMQKNTLKYSAVVFLGGASYGVMAATIKCALAEGFSWTQTAASQAFFGALLFAVALAALTVLGKRPVPLSPKRVLSLLGLGLATCTTCVLYNFALTMLPVSVAITLLFQFTWIGIVFQDYQLLTDRNVFMNLYYVMKATGWKREDQIRERIDQVLKLVDLEAKSYKMPFELSGGEQQRLVIARALLNDPQVLLADEPTGNLDPVTAEGIMRLFQEIAGRGCAVVMSTHNTALIENYPARAILFAQGKIREVDLKAELG